MTTHIPLKSERPFALFPEMCLKKCRKWMIRIQKKTKAAQKMRIIEKNRYSIQIIKKCCEFF